MKYQFEIEYQTGVLHATATSKTYKTRDQAHNAMMKAIKATDILNELKMTNISASGRVTEVNA